MPITWYTDALSAAPMPFPAWGILVVEHAGLIYILNGTGNTDYLGAYLYDPALNAWTTKTGPESLGATTYPREDAMGDIIGDKVHLVGGYTNGTSDRHIVYDISTDSWSIAANVQTFNQKVLAAAVGDLLYAQVFTAPGTSPLWYSYDSTSDTWTELSPFPDVFPTSPYDFSYEGQAVALGTDIYVHSTGFDDGRLFKYDTVADAWSEMTGAPFPRGEASVVRTLDNRILVLFGYWPDDPGGNYASVAVEIYDPGTNSWTADVDAPVPGRMEGGAGLLPDGSIHHFGGYYGSSLSYATVTSDDSHQKLVLGPPPVSFGPASFDIGISVRDGDLHMTTIDALAANDSLVAVDLSDGHMTNAAFLAALDGWNTLPINFYGDLEAAVVSFQAELVAVTIGLRGGSITSATPVVFVPAGIDALVVTINRVSPIMPSPVLDANGQPT